MEFTNNNLLSSVPYFMSTPTSYAGSENHQFKQPDINADAPIITNLFNLMTGKCTLNDVFDDFKKNGIDTPYDLQEEDFWLQNPMKTKPMIPLEATLTEEQLRVLRSLPSSCVYQLLKYLEANGVYDFKRYREIAECRFCKNNGERESFYRSHNLKDSNGRVLCPVLRAYVCHCCGASGDNAHTIKYCPRSTDEERMVSSAMLRSVRMASGRRRTYSRPRVHSPTSSATAPAQASALTAAPASSQASAQSAAADAFNAYQSAPLDPLWAALEKKLMLY